jgi:hypothetical protein
MDDALPSWMAVLIRTLDHEQLQKKHILTIRFAASITFGILRVARFFYLQHTKTYQKYTK